MTNVANDGFLYFGNPSFAAVMSICSILRLLSRGGARYFHGCESAHLQTAVLPCARGDGDRNDQLLRPSLAR